MKVITIFQILLEITIVVKHFLLRQVHSKIYIGDDEKIKLYIVEYNTQVHHGQVSSIPDKGHNGTGRQILNIDKILECDETCQVVI